MFLLLLLWAFIGLCLGLLALPARLHPMLRYAWLILPFTGIVIAIPSGMVGIFLLGKDVTTALVLWVTIIGLVFLPRVFTLQWFGQRKLTADMLL